MARKSRADQTQRRVLFARIGWMSFYNGPIPGDERPISGGRYNKTKIGHEVYNFQKRNGRLYGYFQPSMKSHAVALERIAPTASDKDSLKNVLLIFVARRIGGGQFVVGWYKNAEIFRRGIRQSPGKPRGYGHFCWAKLKDCALLPDENRKCEIPSGKGGMGEANVCYSLEINGSEKSARWIKEAIDFVDDYKGENLLETPESDAMQESAETIEKALARSSGQGFPRTKEERDSIEKRAMTVAEGHYKNKGFKVENVSARRAYDLECRKGKKLIHVEVKGTTSPGNTIVLTHNEVAHASDPKNFCALFVVHSIRLKNKKASGGASLIFEPWKLKKQNLKTINFTYRVT
ncbi:MAG: DUF3883 domain-containing protein [Proteobacteria bacterium]|nr:DUF3883 domain-containing protein [Pseudomonadota bacterium]